LASNTHAALRDITSFNPATGKILQEFKCASESEVHQAVAHARGAQAAWHELGVEKRLRILRNFQRLLHRNKSNVATLIAREAGKPAAEALVTEVMVVLDACRFCIANGYAFLRDERISHGNLTMKAKTGRIVRQPHGVIGIISPWNYPFSIPATETLAALATGNAVVLKPSELTSMTALRLAELLHEAGISAHVFQVLVGDGSTGAALLSSAIDKLIFTGSVSTGKRIAEAAAARLLPVVLELGGKDPMLVLDDASLDVASSGAVWGAFVNAGQACLSVERCYVHRSISPKFLDACADKISKLRVGDGVDPQTDVGPLIHDRQLRLVEAQVEDAARKGARILAGGRRLREIGPNFYAPTLLCDVTHEMRIMREETFGPVLPVMSFDDDEEAIRLANDSDYGLAASVWTGDRKRGERIARRLDAGTVMVNDVISCFGISEAPHGGVKASGLGRTHGRFGFDEMVRIKYLDFDRMPRMKKVWWYGYSQNFTRGMEGFVDALFASTWRDKLRGSIRAMGALSNRKL
jgi:acyl-CoA reductase-like NAD-dependent aldehyde dehydrogenase